MSSLCVVRLSSQYSWIVTEKGLGDVAREIMQRQDQQPVVSHSKEK